MITILSTYFQFTQQLEGIFQKNILTRSGYWSVKTRDIKQLQWLFIGMDFSESMTWFTRVRGPFLQPQHPFLVHSDAHEIFFSPLSKYITFSPPEIPHKVLFSVLIFTHHLNTIIFMYVLLCFKKYIRGPERYTVQQSSVCLARGWPGMEQFNFRHPTWSTEPASSDFWEHS